jgi:triacylglycerol esterase/lipase EstA (alpha/beta hydrolase family)
MSARFNKFDPVTHQIESHHDVDVTYGQYFSDPKTAPETSITHGRKRAILFSNYPETYNNWAWCKDQKVHFICHSQGGTTIRCLIDLMARGAGGLHDDYFKTGGRDDWTVSVTTIGTPHKGSTIINVLANLLQVFFLSFFRLSFYVQPLFPSISYGIEILKITAGQQHNA